MYSYRERSVLKSNPVQTGGDTQKLRGVLTNGFINTKRAPKVKQTRANTANDTQHHRMATTTTATMLMTATVGLDGLARVCDAAVVAAAARKKKNEESQRSQVSSEVSGEGDDGLWRARRRELALVGQWLSPLGWSLDLRYVCTGLFDRWLLVALLHLVGIGVDGRCGIEYE